MANNNNYSASSSSQPDEISLFLQQILLRSSTSSSTSSYSFPSNQDPEMGRIYVPDPDPSWFQVTSSVAPFDNSNDPDEYDCESEEGGEGLVEEAPMKSTAAPPRNSSKRSRAAEVHNLSEKRRRSRINEKMKALQNLIPNSNKTDKASMLDEAIEYLKQLQLQVQMLTMRNGLSQYPICLPGMPSMNISETNKPVKMSSENALSSMDQNISADTLLGLLPDNCVKQVPNPDFSAIIGSKPLFEIESSSSQANFGPFHFSSISSTGCICPDEILPCQELKEDCSQTRVAGRSTSSIRVDAEATYIKDSTLDELVAGHDAQLMLPNLFNNSILSRQLKN